MAVTFRKYKVSIKRIDVVDVIGQEWQKIADKGNEKDNGPVYAYVKLDRVQDRETELLTQEITDEGLDIKNVIKAINGL